MTKLSAARALLTLLLTGGVMGCSTTGSADSPDAIPTIPAFSVPPASPSPAATAPATAGSPPATRPASSTPSASTMFPLVIDRTGGFAGVQDRVSIEADGTATVTRRGQQPVRVSVPAADRADLRRLLAAPAASAAATPGKTPVCADGFHYEITSPALTAVVEDCGGPHSAAVTAVLSIATRLLNG